MTQVSSSDRARWSRTTAALLVATTLAACTGELAPTRPITLRLEKGAWTDTLSLAEIATLAVTVTGDGQPVAGVGLTWTSTDSSVVTVSRAPSGGPGESSRAVVIGHGPGQAAIVVRVAHAGITADSLRVPVAVRRGVADSLTSLTVGDVTTVGVTLARTDQTWRTGAKVEWTSNDPSVAQVVPATTDPTRAVVTARASGRAQVTATVTTDRLARAVLQLPIRVGAVLLSPDTLVAAWPDTLTVTDTARLPLTKNRAGAKVTWTSTNYSAFRVDSGGVVTALAQGGGEIVASVGEAGFQVAEFRKSLVVLPLVVKEATPWASYVNVTNSQPFTVTARDGRDSTKVKVLPVTWRSTNETAFTVDATGLVVGRSRGGGELIATVGVAPFQTSELRKSISVRQKWSSVSAGYLHTCAIAASDGSAWCWGDNKYGELGIGPVDPFFGRTVPNRVATGAVLEQISAGGGVTDVSPQAGTKGMAHTCGRAGNDNVFCWGSNDGGQLGNGGLLTKSLPTQVAWGPNAAEQTQLISAGGQHTCAFQRSPLPGQSGSYYCWGVSGTRGTRLDGFSFGPLPVTVGGSSRAFSIATGSTFVCLSSSFVRCRGAGWRGDNPGNVTDSIWNAGEDFVRLIDGNILVASNSLTAGGTHACALSNGGVLCWGGNGSGQLGSLPPQAFGGPGLSTAALVVPLANASGVSAGLTHTCAVDVTNTAFCWGSNSHGQLGIGSSSPGAFQTPTLVAGGLAFLSVSAGAFHSCGVTLDGSLYCWGGNDRGQLGDGTTATRIAPVRVVDPP